MVELGRLRSARREGKMVFGDINLENAIRFLSQFERRAALAEPRPPESQPIL